MGMSPEHLRGLYGQWTQGRVKDVVLLAAVVEALCGLLGEGGDEVGGSFGGTD